MRHFNNSAFTFHDIFLSFSSSCTVKKFKLTHDFECPVHLPVDKRVVEEKAADEEDNAVEVFQFWLINNGCQDQVAGHQDRCTCDDDWYLQVHRKYLLVCLIFAVVTIQYCYDCDK